MDTSTYTVGSLAQVAGVTVRTLHHYDEIGLVRPAARSEAGYRLYQRRDLERLQEVLFFRELGFGLDDIARILAEPGYRRHDALRRQRTMLEVRAARIFDMIDAIDTTLDREEHGMNLTPDEMFEVFGDFDPAEYEQEAKERWGDTDAYQESAKRVRRYTKDDWKALQAEAESINQAMLALMAEGESPDGIRAMDLAEQHRAHISRWFYECTPEIHAGLGQMYVADPRFTESIDRAGEGLARFLSEAIAANGRRR